METGFGSTVPHPGGLPADQILWYLADALGLQRCPWIILSGIVGQFHGAVFYCHETDKAEGPGPAQRGAEAAAREDKVVARRRTDRAVLLADPERVENFHHARRVRSAVRRASGRHIQRRAVHSGIFSDLA